VLTLLGFGMVITFMVLIMTRRLSPMVALIGVPILFAVVGGFGGKEVGVMMLDGIKTLAPTGVMLMFAILYFAIMIDAGLFDPIVKRILRLVGGDPLKVLVGTAILAAAVSLDGDGSTTYMITVASMLPLYRRIGMNPLHLTCVTILASGVMNLTPWGGPLARAASALHVDPADIFLHMLPSMAVGVAGVIGLAYFLGRSERRRLGVLSLASETPAARTDASAFDTYPADRAGCNCPYERHEFDCEHSINDSALLPTDSMLRRPRLLWFNAVLTAALMTALVLQLLPMPVLFMVGLAVALVMNYPKVEDQRERIAEHAKNVIAVVALIFAAGIFTGILAGTGMVDSMSKSFLAVIPDAWGPHLASITAVASMPFTFFISNDAFYYGVLPIVTDAANAYGISDAEMARASLIGQPVHLLSPLVPSTYLLVGLAGVDFGDHQRFALKWAIAICLLMMVAALLTGAFPIFAS
jgi:citrate-Mg2+:H+ or citrate-Ca2+:H+ symporter, CitMHS family